MPDGVSPNLKGPLSLEATMSFSLGNLEDVGASSHFVLRSGVQDPVVEILRYLWQRHSRPRPRTW